MSESTPAAAEPHDESTASSDTAAQSDSTKLAQDGADARVPPGDSVAADYGPPFDAKSFGGQFIWASGSSYECKILRVRAGQKVIISTARRKDMVVLLTGGRGVLEIIDDRSNERTELLPGQPMAIEPERDYRLVAITEIELFSVHSPLDE